MKSEPIYNIGNMCEFGRDLENLNTGCMDAGVFYWSEKTSELKCFCDTHAREQGLNISRAKILAFVLVKHNSQVRKYTGEPYFIHLIAVAEMADGKCAFGWEIGLCHDMLEDTDCTKEELLAALNSFGYDFMDSTTITHAVIELTDIYTSENYPLMNRKERKKLEALRLHKISPDAQTVKYCDLINNTSSIVEHDPKFAITYLAEKKEILAGMDKGDQTLLQRCWDVLREAKDLLEQIRKSIIDRQVDYLSKK